MTQNHGTSEIDRIHVACRKLSMQSVSETLADVLQEAAANNMSHAEVLAVLLEAEIESLSSAEIPSRSHTRGASRTSQGRVTITRNTVFCQ